MGLTALPFRNLSGVYCSENHSVLKTTGTERTKTKPSNLAPGCKLVSSKVNADAPRLPTFHVTHVCEAPPPHLPGPAAPGALQTPNLGFQLLRDLVQTRLPLSPPARGSIQCFPVSTRGTPFTRVSADLSRSSPLFLGL